MKPDTLVDKPSPVPEKKKYELESAQLVAESLCVRISGLCERLQIAGSIRRRKSLVSDIELVCIPKFEKTIAQGELFPSVHNLVIAWIDEMERVQKLTREKGGDRFQRIRFMGLPVDLFMTDADEWGRMLAIRTGPATYSTQMATRWEHLGWKGIDGRLKPWTAHTRRYVELKGNHPVFPDEQSFFNFLGWPMRPPEQR